jgi:hypothetical protein
VTATVVADASALIAFQQIGQLSLLQKVFMEVIVPPAVAREIQPSVPPVSWIVQRALAQPIAPLVLRASLGAGESEALSLAVELRADRLLVDELLRRGDQTPVSPRQPPRSGLARGSGRSEASVPRLWRTASGLTGRGVVGRRPGIELGSVGVLPAYTKVGAATSAAVCCRRSPRRTDLPSRERRPLPP